MIADELAHIFKQIAGQQQNDFKPFVYGHIANYDNKLHRVRVIVPSLRDDDPAPVLSGWMPLLASAAGLGYGIQIAPFGGATVESPTSGEQVVIGRFDLVRGVCACMGQSFNQAVPPPSAALDPPLEPGEILVFHKSGTFTRYSTNGDKQESGQGNVVISTIDGKTIIIAASGSSVEIDGTGNVTITRGSMGQIMLANLPTVSPGVPTAIWRDGTVVRIV